MKNCKYMDRFIISLILITILVSGCTHPENQEIILIAHAMGGIDEVSYTNSKEGFDHALSQGSTVFEADFEFTSDEILILRHDWKNKFEQDNFNEEAPTYEEFMATPMLGKYTPLSFEDVLHLMDEHKEITLITDTKYSDKETVEKQFRFMLDKAKELDLTEVLDRMIVQIYTEEMLTVIHKLYPFQEYIFTLYQKFKTQKEDLDLEEIAMFCNDNDIQIVTIPKKKVDEDVVEIMRNHGIEVYTHTVNSKKQYKKFVKMGVTGFYSDFLNPTTVK